MLAATLFHALRLERALGVLKRDRAALEELVDAFQRQHTAQAEQGIERLRTAADGAGRQIARQTDVATGLKDDLVFLIERGERLADQLDGLVRVGRTLAVDAGRSEPGLDRGRLDMGRFDAGRLEVNRLEVGRPEIPHGQPARARTDPSRAHGVQAPDVEQPMPRVRSQAERDLLKALRMAR